jgi:hypothetical protein
MLTVPACSDCNGGKSTFDAPLQHYLLSDVDASEHPQARQLLFTKMRTAVSTHRAPLLDRFKEGTIIPEITPNRIWVRNPYQIPIDFQPVETGLVYLLRGLHYAVFGETKQPDEIGVDVIRREHREQAAEHFFSLGVGDWHSQGDVFAVAWANGSTHVYWMIEFFGAVLFMGRSAKTFPLYGPSPSESAPTRKEEPAPARSKQ